MKKIFIIFIFLLLAHVKTVYASEITNFSIDDYKANIGDEVTVKLNINNNPGFGLLTLKVHYDMDDLEYVSSSIKGLDEAIIKDSEDDGKGNVVLYAILINTNKLIEDNGQILNITYKVKNTKVRQSRLKIEVFDYGIDENRTLEYKVDNGYIYINDNMTTDDTNNIGISGSNTWNFDGKLNNELDDEKGIATDTMDDGAIITNDDNNEENEGLVITDEEDNSDNDDNKDDNVLVSKNKDSNYIIIMILVLMGIGIVTYIVIRKLRKKNEK